jgi:hypothetical protein
MRNKLGRFLKGIKAWNKEKKDFRPSKSTEFSSGEHHTGHKHPSWKGGVQKNKHDCVYVWDGTNKRKRRPRVVWENYNGELPKGYVIYHIDGDKNNDHISNLEAITRAELLKRNNTKKKL